MLDLIGNQVNYLLYQRKTTGENLIVGKRMTNQREGTTIAALECLTGAQFLSKTLKNL